MSLIHDGPRDPNRDPQITLPTGFFHPAGEFRSTDKASRLLGMFWINGVPFHVDAYLVTTDDEGVQHFSGDFGATAAKVYTALGADGGWQTVTIDGREYALIITPHCN